MKTERIVIALVMLGGSTALLTSCVERPVDYVPTSQTSPATVNATQPAQTPLSVTNHADIVSAPQPPPAAVGVTVPSASAPSANAVPRNFSPGVAEVVKLAQSGVGDEVVLAFVRGSQLAYNLSADDIVALKNAGLSSPVMAAMINHDQSLRNQTHPPSYEQKLYAPLTPPVSLPRVTPPPLNGIPEATTVPNAPTIADTWAAPSNTPSTAVPAQSMPSAAPSAAVVEGAPPAPRVEMIPVAPGPDHFWVGGYWRWNGAWVWVGGRWVARPWYGAVWVGGHWARHGRGYVWVDGHWR